MVNPEGNAYESSTLLCVLGTSFLLAEMKIFREDFFFSLLDHFYYFVSLNLILGLRPYQRTPLCRKPCFGLL